MRHQHLQNREAPCGRDTWLVVEKSALAVEIHCAVPHTRWFPHEKKTACFIMLYGTVLYAFNKIAWSICMMYLQHGQVNTAIGILTFELPDFHCFKFQLQSLLFFLCICWPWLVLKSGRKENKFRFSEGALNLMHITGDNLLFLWILNDNSKAVLIHLVCLWYFCGAGESQD